MADKKTDTREWFKNAGKSMGNITRDMMVGIMPATVQSASSAREAMRDARKFGTQFAQISRTQMSHIDRSSASKKARAIFDSAMKDLKDGTFGIDKSMDDMFDDFDDDISDDLSMDSFDDDAEISSDEIVMTSSRGVAKSVMRASAAQLEGLQQMTKAIIGSSLKGSQASATQMTNAIMYMGDAINQNLIGIGSTLSVINKNLVNLIEFQNENVSPTNQAIVNYLEESAIMMKDVGKMLKSYEQSREGQVKEHRTFDAASGFDLGEYKKFVKKNFNNNPYISLLMVAKDLMGAGGGNPLGNAIGSAMEAIIPKTLKESMKIVDKNLHSYIQEALFKLGDMSNDMNPIKQILGDVFGAKRQTNNSIRLGRFQKEAMPWNGIAQKYLTEVIPELLTSIDSKMPVSKKYNANSRRYYDESTGQFISREKLLAADKEDVQGYLAMSFIDPVNNLMEQLKLNGASSQTQTDAITKLSALINDRITERSSIGKSRTDVGDVLTELGLNPTQFRQTMNGFEEGIREFTRFMNERNDMISTSGSVYRNLNNTKGDDSWKRYGSLNPFAFYFGGTGEYNPSDEIETILYSANRDPSIANDRELIKAYQSAKMGGADYDKLRKIVLDYESKKRIKEQVKGGIGKLRAKFAKDGSGRTKTTQKIKDIIDEVDNRAFEMTYGINRRERRTAATRTSASGSSDDDGPAQPSHIDTRSTAGVGAASSFYTDRMGVKAGIRAPSGGGTGRKLHSQYAAFGSVAGWREASNKIGRMTDRILKTNTSNILNQSDEEIGAKDEIIMGELKNQMQEEPDSTVEGSIAQMNNTTRTGFLAILNSFQNMSSGIFGKDGFIKKFFTSDGFKNIVTDIKEKLIGENGAFKEQWSKLKNGGRDIWGKTKGHLANGYDWVYRNTMIHLLGENYENDDLYKNYLSAIDIKKKTKSVEEKIDKIEKDVEAASESIEFAVKPPEEHEGEQAMDVVFSAADKLADEILESGKTTVEATLGDPEETPEKKKKSFWSKFKSTLPKAIAGGIIGAGAVALTGGSLGLLGSMFMPHSIIGGAIVGLGTTILSQTEAFKSVMFGKMNENGEREGGLINEEMQKSFKKALPAMVGGATLGLIKNVLTGGNGIFSKGPLGVVMNALLPGGPIGGALIGMGISILKNNDTIKDKLFGAKDQDGKRSNGLLSNAYNKLTGLIKKNAPTIKRGATGAALGALTGLTLSHMGFIPAMFSLGGPVGGAIGGLALGIASSTKKFNEWLFGSEELDENGNPTGRRNKDGILGRVRNLLMVHVFEPIGDVAKKTLLNMGDHVKNAIEIPFRLAFGPIIDGLRGVKDNITDVVSNTFTNIQNGLMNVVKTTMNALFKPMSGLVRKMASGMGKMVEGGMKIATLPITAPLKILEIATMGKRRGQYLDFYKNYFGNLGGVLTSKWDNEGTGTFGKVKDVFSAIFNPDNELKDAAREGWNETMKLQGKDSLNWRSAAKDRRQLKNDRNARKKEENMWAKANALRRQLVTEWGGRQFDLRDTEVAELRKKFSKFGLDESKLQTSDDIMDLVYRRGAWKKKGADGQEGIVVAKSREDKAHEDKVDKGVDYLEEIRDMFREISFQSLNKDWDAKTRQQQTAAMRKLRKYGKKYNINLDPFYEMGDTDRIEASELSDADWNEYRSSTFYSAGDYKGWLKSRGTTTSGGSADPTANMSAVEKAMYHMMERNAEASEAANVIATGGASISEINENAKASGGIRRKFFDKFHISQSESFNNIKKGLGSVFDTVFKRKDRKDKKDARDAREAEEQARAEALGNPNEGADITNDGQYIVYPRDESAPTEKKKGIFGTILGALGTAGSFISGLFGGSKKSSGKFGIFGSLLKGWGIASMVIGLINAFNPGFSDDLAKRADSISENMPDIVEKYVTPFVGNVVDTIGKGISGAIDFATKNASTIYNNFLKPIGNSFMNLVTEYGPAFIEKSVDVMTSLIPSMTDAFVRVVPKLVTSLTTSIWKSTGGKFFGNQSDTKQIKEDDIAYTIYDDNGNPVAYQTEDGRYATINPVTGEWETTGKRTNIGPNGERYTIGNAGAQEAFAKLGVHSAFDMMAKGSKSIAGKVIRGSGKVLGGTMGGIAGAAGNILHIPGLSIAAGAKVGSKAGGGITGLFTKIFESIGNKGVAAAAERSAAEAAVESVIKNTADIGFTNAADTAGKTLITEVAEKAVKTGAEEAGNVIVAAGKKAASNASKIGVEAVTDAMVEGAESLAKNGKAASLIAKLADGFAGSKGLVGKVGNWLLNTIKKISSKLKGMTSGVGKFIDKACAKLGLGAAKALPIISAVFVGIDGITGAMEANNLFHTSSPDGCMRVVSSIIKMLLGLGIVGPVIDCVFEIGSSLLGTDIKCEMATFIYTILMGEEKGKILKMSQEQQAIEAEVYNSIMGTNLSEDAYNDLKNKTVGKSIFDTIGGWFSPTKRAQNEAERKAIEEAQYYAAMAVNNGERTLGQSKTTTSSTSSNDIVPTSNLQGEMDAGYAYGLGYGKYTQGDRRWGKMRIGTLPNGKAATMSNAGCGPTALAMAANDLGRGAINPASVGAFAARNGYISAGGANAGLFTEGAARMGMNSVPVRNKGDLAAKIASGNPVILSGRSNSSKDPYTRAGHIVVAEGMDRSGRVKVKDPLDGASKRYRFSDLAKSTRAGFALGRGRGLGYGHGGLYSLGYGDYTISDADYNSIFTGNMSEAAELKANREKYANGPSKGSLNRLQGAARTQYINRVNNLKLSSAQKAFMVLSIDSTIAFAIRALREGADFNDPAVNPATGELLEIDATRVSINRSEVIAKLDDIRKGHTINDSTPTSDQKKAADVLYTALHYTYKSSGKSKGEYTTEQFLKHLLFSRPASGGGRFGSASSNLYTAWNNGWLPNSDPYIFEWGQMLTKDSFAKNSSYSKNPPTTTGTLKMREFISRLKAIGNSLQNGAAQQYYNVAATLERLYKIRLEVERTGKASTEVEKAIVKEERAKAMSSIYAEIVADLAAHKVTDYTTNNINGYVTYNIDDPEWSKIKYWDKAFGEGNLTTQSPVMAMSSILTTMTGKAFTPKLMIEKILPYIGHKNADGTAMPYRVRSNSSGDSMFYFDPLNSTATKNFFGMDFIQDAGGNTLNVTPVSYTVGVHSDKLNRLRNDLANGIPFVMPSVPFNGSIFGGVGDPPSSSERSKREDLPWGILQNYFPGLDRIHYLSTGETRPLYSAGKNIFERYPREHFYNGGYTFQMSDGTVPQFKMSANQYGILADGIEEPEVEEDESGPFALLKKLMKGILKAGNALLGTIIKPFTGSKDELLDESARSIEGTMNSLGSGLGYGPDNSLAGLMAGAKLSLTGNGTPSPVYTSPTFKEIREMSNNYLSTLGGSTVSNMNKTTTPNAANMTEQDKIWNFLLGEGFTKEAAAGIMGCWEKESANKASTIEGYYLKGFPGYESVMNSRAVMNNYVRNVLWPALNGKYNPAGYEGGDGNLYPGIGLAQWTGPRGLKLLNYTKSAGQDWKQTGAQLNYFMKEINDRGIKSILNGASSPEKAAHLFLDRFEMYNGFGSKYPSKLKTRQDAAIKYYQKYFNSSYVPGVDYYDGVYNSTSTDGTDVLSDGGDWGILSRAIGGLIYSRMNNTDFQTGFNAMSGLNLFNFDSTVAKMYGLNSSTGSVAGVTPPKSLASARPQQQALVNQMLSVYNKLKYSTAGGKQNPDQGWGSCASTVNWAYRKVFGNLGLTSNENNGASSLSRRADGVGSGDLWTPVWKKTTGSARIPTSLMEPGDLVFMNMNRQNLPYDPNITYPMGHVEMYAGDGQDINHGGPNEGDIGPNYAPVNDWRKARIMMVSRFNKFIDGGGYGLGYGDPDIDSAALNAMGISRTAIKDKLDYAWESAQKSPTKIEYHENYGYGPGATEVARALRNDKSGKILQAILNVISEWHGEAKGTPSGGNLTVNNTTNTVVHNEDASTTVKKSSGPITQEKMDSTRLRELHREISTIKKKK